MIKPSYKTRVTCLLKDFPFPILLCNCVQLLIHFCSTHGKFQLDVVDFIFLTALEIVVM